MEKVLSKHFYPLADVIAVAVGFRKRFSIYAVFILCFH